MTKSRHSLPPRKYWTPTEDGLLRQLFARKTSREIAAFLGSSINRVNSRARKIGLRKDADYVHTVNLASGRRVARDGLTHRFSKDHVPANKGTRRPGWFRGRMRETWFKKGHRNEHGHCPWVPVGSLTWSSDGYLIRKVRNDLRGAQRWRREHVLIWEKKHGPLPAGHVVVFKDRNRRNVKLSNLELITLAENMRRNSIHARRSPAEKRAIMQLAALKRKIREWEENGGRRSRGSTQHPVQNPQAALD